MVTLRLSGNISDEATTPLGNILPEAMHPAVLIVAGQLWNRDHTVTPAKLFPEDHQLTGLPLTTKERASLIAYESQTWRGGQ
jgi:hypothetical protein